MATSDSHTTHPRSVRDAGIAAAIAVALELEAASIPEEVEPVTDITPWLIASRARMAFTRSRPLVKGSWGQPSGWRRITGTWGTRYR